MGFLPNMANNKSILRIHIVFLLLLGQLLGKFFYLLLLLLLLIYALLDSQQELFNNEMNFLKINFIYRSGEKPGRKKFKPPTFTYLCIRRNKFFLNRYLLVKF